MADSPNSIGHGADPSPPAQSDDQGHEHAESIQAPGSAGTKLLPLLPTRNSETNAYVPPAARQKSLQPASRHESKSASPPLVPQNPPLRPALVALQPRPRSNSQSRRPELPRSDWQLPPKPKPGRKAATDIPTDKRKASNRSAQRAFRERKRAKLTEMESQMEEAKRAALCKIQDAERRIAEMKQQLADMQQNQVQAKSQSPTGQPKPCSHHPGQHRAAQPLQPAHLSPLPPTVPESFQNYQIQPPINTSLPTPATSTCSSHRSSDSNISPLTVLPPGLILPHVPDMAVRSQSDAQRIGCGSSSAQPATDDAPFSLRLPSISQSSNRQGQSLPAVRARPPRAHPSPQGDALEMDFTNFGNPQPEPKTESPDVDPCGFCDEGTYCVCREAELTVPSGRPVEPEFRPSGPGSCASCLEDPVRRKMCIDIASKHSSDITSSTAPLRTKSTSDHVRNASDSGGMATHQGGRGPATSGYVSCSEAISMAQSNDPNLPNQPYYEDWLRNLRTAPPANRDGRHCSAQDVEVASILQTLRGTNATKDGDGTSSTET